jgi:predicted dehydrogenase
MANEHYGDERASGTYAGCTIYKDFRELCARPDIDAVVISTPDHWHALHAVEAMLQGKDVYCEKPLGLTVHETRAMVDTARRYGRILQTGSQQRSDETFRFACELVRNGRIGNVHTVHVNVGGPPVECFLPAETIPEGLDWDFWLGPAPWRPYHSDIAPGIAFEGWPNWRAYRDYAGGGMTDIGAHHYDIAQWGLGMDHTTPIEITPPDGAGVERLTYRYANGITMYHTGGAEGAAVEFIGSDGRVSVNRGQFLKTEPEGLVNDRIGPDEIHLYSSDNHHRDWLTCLRTRQRPICDVEIGHRSATVCNLGNIAYWLKRPLKWDPNAERFINDPLADRQLSRPMRGEWSV